MEAGVGFHFPNIERHCELEWLFFEELQRSLEIPLIPPEVDLRCNNLQTHYDYTSFSPPASYISYDEAIQHSFEADFHLWNECPCPSLCTEDPWKPINPQALATNTTNLFFNDDQFLISHNNNCFFVNDQTLNAVVEEGIKKRSRKEDTLISENYDQSLSINNNNNNNNQKVSKIEGLKYEEIRKYFEMPISKAAKELNVGLTVLKKRCRELNIKRWPHRKIKSLKALISNVKEMGMTEMAEMLEEQRKKLQVLPEMELTAQTKRLRQACFKANYKKRRALAFFSQY